MSSITSSRQQSRSRPIDHGIGGFDRVAGPAGARGPGRDVISVGVDGGGHSLLLPAEHASVLIGGDSGAGKSYLLGWFAEEVIRRGMVAMVIDPEGDHTGLGQLEDVVVLDHPRVLSDRAVIDFIREGISVVADLSRIPGCERMQWAARIGRVTDLCRGTAGLPNWIMIDEAHAVLNHLGWELTGPGGYCLATYRPDELPPPLSARITHRLTVDQSQVVAVQPTGSERRRARGLPVRTTRHIRHQHKYLVTDLSEDRGFHFRDDDGSTGFVATNVRQLVEHLRCGTSRELVHHCRGGDLSRWFREVYRDDQLADAVAEQERQIRSEPADYGQARQSIIEIVQDHFLRLSGTAR